MHACQGTGLLKKKTSHTKMPVSTRTRVTPTTTKKVALHHTDQWTPHPLHLIPSRCLPPTPPPFPAKFFHSIMSFFPLFTHPFLPNALAPFLLHIALLMGKSCLVVQKPDVPLGIIAASGFKSQDGGEGPGFIDFELGACLHFLLLWQRWTCECDYGNQGEGLAAGPPTSDPPPPRPRHPPSSSVTSVPSEGEHLISIISQLVLLPATRRQISGCSRHPPPPNM